jgi:hypothetical protein
MATLFRMLVRNDIVALIPLDRRVKIKCSGAYCGTLINVQVIT